MGLKEGRRGRPQGQIVEEGGLAGEACRSFLQPINIIVEANLSPQNFASQEDAKMLHMNSGFQQSNYFLMGKLFREICLKCIGQAGALKGKGGGRALAELKFALWSWG